MIVQWCIKGLALDSDSEAKLIIDSRLGLACNWWRNVGTINPADVRTRLSARNLDLHVNHFSTVDPATGDPFSRNSPFISLAAGTIERDRVAQTNYVRRARRTALWFGTRFGRSTTAYLYTCWVLVAPRAAVEIEGIAEEIRDLNTYRRYSAYQTEGEIAAKILVPDNHIQSCEKWDVIPGTKTLALKWTHSNRRFTPPERLTNVRELV
jgi:hypothetical protein